MKIGFRAFLLLLLALCAGCGIEKIFLGECDALERMVKAPFKRVKVMSWNLHAGMGLDGVRDMARAAAVIRAAKVDFACLQEIDRATKRSGGVDQLDVLEKGTGMHATWCKTLEFQGGEYGIALLSRDAPLDVRTLSLPGAGEPRKLLVAEFAECLVGVTHLSLDAAERLAAVETLRAPLNPDKPFFLAGDWNDTPGSALVRALRGPFALVSDQKPTFPANAPARCIDYVAVSRRHRARFEHVSGEVLAEAVVSDHRPVVVTLR